MRRSGRSSNSWRASPFASRDGKRFTVFPPTLPDHQHRVGGGPAAYSFDAAGTIRLPRQPSSHRAADEHFRTRNDSTGIQIAQRLSFLDRLRAHQPPNSMNQVISEGTGPSMFDPKPSRWKSRWDPLRKWRISLSGIFHAIASDGSVARKFLLSVAVLVPCFLYRQWVDFLLLFVVTGVMITAELFNTALEVLCDLVESKENEQIRIIKDTSAAACSITEIVWTVTLVVEIYRGSKEVFGSG